MTDTSEPHDAEHRQVGLWARIADAAHDTVAGKIDERKNAHVAGILETFERDLQPLIAPFVQPLLDDDDTPEHVRALLKPLVAPEHFSESIVVGIALGSVLSPVLQAALDPLLTELAKKAWQGAIGGVGALGGLPLSPSIATAAVLKGVLTEGNAATQALQSGVTPDTFHTMVLAAGNAIGIAEALLLLRREQITDDDFTRVLRYSNINPDFYAMARALRYGPPTVGEAIAGALKGHLTDAEARTKIAHAGIDPAEYEWLLATAGRPPGVEMVVQLWNRDLATEADVDRTIRQSDINPDFADLVKATRWYQIPPRSIVPMLRAGGITEQRARQLLTQHGVRAEDQDAFIAEAQHTSTSTAKELTQAQVVRMFESQFIDRGEAQARLTALHYPADQIAMILDYAAQARLEKLKNALVTKVGTLYVAHKITKADAVTPLNGAGIPTAAQHDLFDIWDIERTANVHVPTAAGVIGAMRRGVITPRSCHLRLNAMGIDDDDVPIFVADGFPPTAPQDAHAAVTAVLGDSNVMFISTSGSAGKAKHLTQAQIVKAYLATAITHAQALTQLEGLGYSATDASLLLSVADGSDDKTLTEAQVIKVFKAGQIDRATAFVQLQTLGYTSADANLLLDNASQ